MCKTQVLTSFLVTGFSSRDKCTSFLNLPRGSRSPNSERLFAVKVNTVRFGIDFTSVGWITDIRFLASSRVCSRSDNGKFPSCWISLSVKSIASCGYKSRKVKKNNPSTGSIHKIGVGIRTPATPRFSIAGILWPSRRCICSIQLIDQKCSTCSLGNAPLRSSSRSLMGLRKLGAAVRTSLVNLMVVGIGADRK